MVAHIIASGRVQGVGFRNAAKKRALQYNLVGWVKNNTDGTVELEISGEQNDIHNYLGDLKSGFNWLIRVDDTRVEILETEKQYDTFSIR